MTALIPSVEPNNERETDMAKEIAEGFWPCTVLGATAGQDDKEQIVVRINVKIDDGPDKGRMVTYEDAVNEKSSLYVRRSCIAAGWQGNSLDTLSSDVTAWVEKTGGKSTVEIRHIEIKNGKRAGSIWAKANSIGRGPKPLTAPAKSSLADANAAMSRAAEADGSAPPMDDVPPVTDGDIPFATSSWTRVNGGVL